MGIEFGKICQGLEEGMNMIKIQCMKFSIKMYVKKATMKKVVNFSENQINELKKSMEFSHYHCFSSSKT